MQTETPFLTFWRGLNEECRARNLAEPKYGVARNLFAAAIEELARPSVDHLAVRLMRRDAFRASLPC